MDGLEKVLELHKKWLASEEGGKRADLRSADLHGANLIYVNLCSADLSGADLSGANLSYVNLCSADLSGADLSGADLSYVNLCSADLSGANLSHANLSGADLRGANLSGAKNLTNAHSADYILAHFERTTEGIIVYKTFGEYNEPNPNWKIEPGSILEEIVNYNRTNECGCGVNVGTLDWVKRYGGKRPIWKCLIRWEWLSDVVVPYHTDGKIRAGRVQLIERI